MALVQTFIFFFGASIGSFAYAFAFRHPIGRPWVSARSQCEHCGRVLSWYELIPLASFLTLKGRCRTCRHSLGLGYIFSEVIAGIVFLLLYRRVMPVSFDSFAVYLIWAVIAMLFAVIAFSDKQHLIIPDSALWALLILAVILKFNAAFFYSPLFFYFSSLKISIVAAIAGGSVLFVIWIISAGKWIGFGDVKLMAVIGFLLGLPGLLWIFYIAVAVGLAFAVLLFALGKAGRKTQLPFGMFLSLSVVFYIIFASQIDSFFFGLLL